MSPADAQGATIRELAEALREAASSLDSAANILDGHCLAQTAQQYRRKADKARRALADVEEARR